MTPDPDDIREDAARYAGLLLRVDSYASRAAIEARYQLYGWRAHEVPAALHALAATLERELNRLKEATQ